MAESSRRTSGRKQGAWAQDRLGGIGKSLEGFPNVASFRTLTEQMGVELPFEKDENKTDTSALVSL